jgi:hypothetical protein
MTHIDGCQIPGYPRIAEGEIDAGGQSPVRKFKRAFARPWNYLVKPQLKRMIKTLYAWKKQLNASDRLIAVPATPPLVVHLKAGDLVRVRNLAEIEATLDPFKELKGCAFLEYMPLYCDSVQRVLQPVERFLDERDYKVKHTRGVVLLEGVLCHGTPVFGKCDRACHLFWREEWLEKIESVPELS